MSPFEKIKSSALLKKLGLFLLIVPNQARPRWWVSTFVNPFVHQKGRRSKIRYSARLDVIPFRKFNIGKQTIIEDYSCINNGMGDVIIGDNCTIGIGCVIIGPVIIGNNVILAQHIVISGLNHGYEDINMPIRNQKCSTA